jgi:transposase
MASLLRRVLGVSRRVKVKDARWSERGLEVLVEPRKGRTRCANCGRRAAGYDRRPQRRWRHLPLGACAVWLCYAPRRVNCTGCGITTEQVPWAQGARSRFTTALEETAAYWATFADKSAVQRLLGISWRAVDEIVVRVVARKRDPARLDAIRRIGIDEFSYRKRHHYLTLVVDHDRARVIWAAPGRSSETLAQFFAELGPQRTAALELITIDIAGGYLKAIREHAPHAQIVLDRFHVQRLASDAVDTVRRQLMREAETLDDRRALKRTRWALLKNPWNLTRRERGKLSELQRYNAPLYRAYLLKESLADLLSSLRPHHAERRLHEWLAWASRSRLHPFVRVARTIREHRDGTLAYVQQRLTNGLSEGINNRIRMIARRAFGFHSPEPLIAMIFLACGGISLEPVLPRPT